eukprot:315115_1
MPSQKILDIIIISNDTIQIEFDIELDDYCDTSLCNILYIGTNDSIEVLSLSVNGITNYIEVSVSNVNGYGIKYSISNANILLPVDKQSHRIYLLLNTTDVILQIDGILQFYYTPIAQFKLPNELCNIYFSNLWDCHLRGTVSNICISSKVAVIHCGDTFRKRSSTGHYYLQLSNNSFPVIGLITHQCGFPGDAYVYSYDTNKNKLCQSSPWISSNCQYGHEVVQKMLISSNVGKYILKINDYWYDWTMTVFCNSVSNQAMIDDVVLCNDTLQAVIQS